MPTRSAQRLCVLALGLLAGCSGDEASPSGLDASDDFPRGDAFILGVAIAPSGLAPLEGVEVVITPDDGGALEAELDSEVQARVLTNRRGEFSFSGIAAGSYVLFVRFDSRFLGVGEVLGRVEATVAPNEIRIAPPPINLRVVNPPDGGVVAPVDTLLLRFTRFTIAELRTLDPASEPLFARVEVVRAGAGGGSGEGGGSGPRPLVFEVPLDEEATNAGSVEVPVEVGSLVGELRLEPVIGLHLDYRDPRAPPAATREIRGAITTAVRR